MASQNRRNYGGYSAPSSGLAFVRGTFIMLVVLILCFGFGFFVLARFMPGAPKPENSHAGAALASTRDGNDSSSGQNIASAEQPAPRVPASKPTPSPATHQAPQGPIIAPGDENPVQQPGNMDTSGKHDENTDNANKPDAHEKPAVGQKPEQKAGAIDKQAGDDTPAPNRSANDDTHPTVSKPHRSNRKPAGEGNDVPKNHTDTPRNGDTDPTPTAPPRDNNDSKPAAAGFYRVQIGVFGTREQAEQLVKEAQGKGFEAQIKVIQKEGQTLYKVQHSAHKTRANAEKEGQKLTEAGFQIYIAGPDK
ncbi:MAG TPA: SPOR domain-containing protein [Chthonomonadaceae bacterium]|nr:SPOR domain-containing protein [Chthonomonadaceae bacterium]